MDTKQNLTTFYIVRHGETEWNVSGIIQGQLDSQLTVRGLQQAQETAQELREIPFDAIFSSDLLRAKRTAEIIKLNRQLAIVTKKALRERTFGDYDGKSAEEYKKETKHLFEKYQQLSEQEQWKFKFTEGYESDEKLLSRFITFIREIAIAFPNKTILVVTHGGTIRTFLMHIGFANYGELVAGTFNNAGYINMQSDGVDFFVKEVKGLKKKK